MLRDLHHEDLRVLPKESHEISVKIEVVPNTIQGDV
jgi:hypothetical protein